MAWLNLCFLDARHFPTLQKIIYRIKQVTASATDEAVLFFLSFPVQQVEIWKRVLIRTFSKKEGYENVTHYYLGCLEEADSTGQAAICIGKLIQKQRFSHVQFVHAPPAHGFVNFGGSTIYVEVKFCSVKNATSHTIGFLWAPALLCVGKNLFSDCNYCGAIRFMMIAVAYQHDILSVNEPACKTPNDMLQSLRAHLMGILLVTDTRSDYFDNCFPVHQWHMSGQLHAVQGTFANGGFLDAYAHEKIALSAACYRIRFQTKEYFLQSHSYDFWPDELLTSIIESPSLNADAAEDLSIGIISCSSAALRVPVALHPDNITDKTEAECMVCLSRPPTFILKDCGHFGLGRHCWKWMCKEQFNRNKSERCQVSPAALTTKKIANIAIMCPYCRKVAKAVHHKCDEDLLKWPKTFVAPDQGPDGWRALNYLKDIKCNVGVLSDNSHGVWNDIRLLQTGTR